MNEKEDVNYEETCSVRHVHESLTKTVEKTLPGEENMRALADFYKVFADPTRIKILCALLISELCVCDLAKVCGMTQSAISHQLRLLKQMKLVKNRRDGKTVYYSLDDSHIRGILSQGMEHITE